MKNKVLFLTWILIAGTALNGWALPRKDMHPNQILKRAGFDQKPGEVVPLDVTLFDETGARVRVGSYFGERPVILVFAYYECPMLCTLILNGFVRGLKPLSFTPGKEFEVVVVSIDHEETPELARAKKDAYLEKYGRPASADGWHFLTGDEASVRALADGAGFKYEYDPENGEYAHAAGLLVLTPEGRISRYLFGIEYAPRDLKFAVMEASHKRIGTLTDQVLLLCYHYDPATGKYTLPILNLLRGAAVLTVVLLAGLITMLLRGEKRKGPRAKPRVHA